MGPPIYFRQDYSGIICAALQPAGRDAGKRSTPTVKCNQITDVGANNDSPLGMCRDRTDYPWETTAQARHGSICRPAHGQNSVQIGKHHLGLNSAREPIPSLSPITHINRPPASDGGSSSSYRKRMVYRSMPEKHNLRQGYC